MGEGDTRQRIIEAALETLRREGFASTSARAIAKTGGFNAALIFYYFGSVNGLLLAALDASSADRLERYRALADEAGTLEELVATALRIYREDLEGGHIAVVAELVGASLSHPELRPEIVARTEPWVELIASTLDRTLAGSPLADLLPSRDVAYATITFYLGVNLFTHLDMDRSRTEALFSLATRLAPVLSPLLQSQGDGSRR